jgi:triosephosphate isomerase
MSRKKIVAGNWKMNTDYNEAIALINNVFTDSKTLINVEKIIFPHFPFYKALVRLQRMNLIFL